MQREKYLGALDNAYRDRLVIPDKQKMMSLRGQASWAKITSPGGKLTALACHPTKKENKIVLVSYLSTNIGLSTLP